MLRTAPVRLSKSVCLPNRHSVRRHTTSAPSIKERYHAKEKEFRGNLRVLMKVGIIPPAMLTLVTHAGWLEPVHFLAHHPWLGAVYAGFTINAALKASYSDYDLKMLRCKMFLGK